MRGKVKWFNDKKGYGFIAKDDGSGDVFAHFGDIEAQGYKTLSEGDVVEFEVIDTAKGQKATKIRKIKSE